MEADKTPSTFHSHVQPLELNLPKFEVRDVCMVVLTVGWLAYTVYVVYRDYQANRAADKTAASVIDTMNKLTTEARKVELLVVNADAGTDVGGMTDGE